MRELLPAGTVIALASLAAASPAHAAPGPTPPTASGAPSQASPAPALPAPPNKRDATFPFEDERLLAPGHTRGGWVHVAGQPKPNARLPVVVFLHGLNLSAHNHMWMGGGGKVDLRASADRVAAKTGAFILAAPSQTKDSATAKRLWTDFDLAAFVDAASYAATSASMGVNFDRQRVFLVGHSGAGCNPDGGLFSSASRDDEMPKSIFAIDPCLDEEMGRSAARTHRPVWVTWQDLEWPRDWNAAMRGFTDEASADRSELFRIELLSILGPDTHNGIVQVAFERALPVLLREE